MWQRGDRPGLPAGLPWLGSSCLGNSHGGAQALGTELPPALWKTETVKEINGRQGTGCPSLDLHKQHFNLLRDNVWVPGLERWEACLKLELVQKGFPLDCNSSMSVAEARDGRFNSHTGNKTEARASPHWSVDRRASKYKITLHHLQLCQPTNN